MTDKIDQIQIIDILNKYLDANNLPIRLNLQGICNGIATIYAKYAAQGQQKEFKAILQDVVDLPDIAQQQRNERIDNFAREIALTFLPQEHDKKLTQFQSISALNIKGKKLSPAYSFAMTTNDKNWIAVFKKINLQDGESMIVRSVNHAVGISKNDEGYEIYDPNYPNGFKNFKNEEEVIRELHFNVFKYTGELGVFTDTLNVSKTLSPIAVPLGLYGSLGMQVDVIRNPEKNERTFPDLASLYATYLSKNEIAMNLGGNYGVGNVHWAIELDNLEALNVLYNKGFQHTELLSSICLACKCNAIKVLPVLLSKLVNPSDKQIVQIFLSALTSGRKEALDILLQNLKYKENYETIILKKENATNFISMAAYGGNDEILQKLITDYLNQSRLLPNTQDLNNAILQGTDLFENAFYAAIEGKSVECVEVLYNQLQTVDDDRLESSLLSNLLHAVKTNQPHMVDFFVDKIKDSLDPETQKRLFSSIHLSTSLCQKTDRSILKKLQDNGAPFSKPAQAILEKKMGRPAGFLLSMGIMLYKFTDFIKEYLLQKNSVDQSIKTFKKLKQESTQIRNEDSDALFANPPPRPLK